MERPLIRRHLAGRFSPSQVKFLAILVPVVLLLVLIPKAVGAPRFCASCHEMRPHYYTFKASSHSRFSCLDCHWKWDRPQIKNARDLLTLNKLTELAAPGLQLGRELTRHFVRNKDLPIIGKNPPLDRACLKCHSLQRKITPRGDLIVPHDRHAAKRVNCVTCHAEAVHGVVASGQQTRIEMGNDQWQEVAAVQQAVFQNPSPPMGVCMTCHKLRRVTLECQACHTDSKRPATHQAGNFLQGHGQQARQDLEACNECHKYSAPAKAANKKPSVEEYARDNPFCADCHGKMPTNHMDSNWKYDHGRGKDTTGCFACHPQNPGQPGTARSTCTQCHSQPHSKDWKRRHPVQVGRGLQGQCFQCHSQATCTRCHMGFQ